MKALAFLGSFFLIISSFAQQNPFKGQSFTHPNTGMYRCATDEQSSDHWENDPQFRAEYFRSQLERSQWDPASGRFPLSDGIYRIPVVVHVIHNGGASNISKQKIDSQIRILNEDFRKQAGTPGFGNGVDTEIEFFLAERDDQGNCTDGVVRIQSSLSNHNRNDEDLLKGLFQWDPQMYLNIWVVADIRSLSQGNNVSG